MTRRKIRARCCLDEWSSIRCQTKSNNWWFPLSGTFRSYSSHHAPFRGPKCLSLGPILHMESNNPSMAHVPINSPTKYKHRTPNLISAHMSQERTANHEISTLSIYVAAATKLGNSLRHRFAITSSSSGRTFSRYNSVALNTISGRSVSRYIGLARVGLVCLGITGVVLTSTNLSLFSDVLAENLHIMTAECGGFPHRFLLRLHTRLTDDPGNSDIESKFDSAKDLRSRFGIFLCYGLGLFQRLNFLAESTK